MSIKYVDKKHRKFIPFSHIEHENFSHHEQIIKINFKKG